MNVNVNVNEAPHFNFPERGTQQLFFALLLLVSLVCAQNHMERAA